MYKHILLPTDGSVLAQKAAKECIALAACFAAKVTIIQVTQKRRMHGRSEMLREEESHYLNIAKASAQALCARLKEDAGATNVECNSVIVPGDEPYKTIIEQAERLKCDLIVMASHGRSGLKGLLLGSETVKVLTHCKVPVLVIR